MAEQTSSAPLTDGAGTKPEKNDIVIDIDIDELPDDGGSEDKTDASNEKLLFAKSTDVRRRIEEKLEVRLLKDELGIDDLDL